MGITRSVTEIKAHTEGEAVLVVGPTKNLPCPKYLYISKRLPASQLPGKGDFKTDGVEGKIALLL